VPIISLGSGADADGQLLIFHDMFGLYPKFTPKMARVYGDAGQVILNGIKQYVEDVTTRDFPQRENWFTMRNSAYEELLETLD
jgi:3-methyl-2-oxobutanoate hydroxymethyltransferase